MKRILKVLYKVLMITGLVCSLYLIVTGAIQAKEAGALYDKTEITQADLKIQSEYKTITTVEGSEPEDFYYKIRKLSGAEFVRTIELEADESISITCTPGDVKVLIFDEKGKQCFFAAVTEVTVSPKKAGVYDIYLVGKKYTGEVKFECE